MRDITLEDRFDDSGDREGVNIKLDGKQFGYVNHLERPNGETYYAGSTGAGWVQVPTLETLISAVNNVILNKQNF